MLLWSFIFLVIGRKECANPVYCLVLLSRIVSHWYCYCYQYSHTTTTKLHSFILFLSVIFGVIGRKEWANPVCHVVLFTRIVSHLCRNYYQHLHTITQNHSPISYFFIGRKECAHAIYHVVLFSRNVSHLWRNVLNTRTQ